MTRDAVAPVRQRPEEILAQTLSAPLHPEATDGWSSRGRRLFLVALAAAGLIFVIAGLLVTKELAPGPGNPTPLETGPGSGLANQLLQSSAGDQPPTTTVAGINIPVPTTPTTRPGRSTGDTPTQLVSPPPPTDKTTNSTTPPTTTPRTTTTLPCGLLNQGLQSAGLPMCNTSAGSKH